MRWLARDLVLAHQCGVGMRVKARVRAWACMPVAGIGAGWRGRRDCHFGPDGLISQPRTGFGNVLFPSVSPLLPVAAVSET